MKYAIHLLTAALAFATPAIAEAQNIQLLDGRMQVELLEAAQAGKQLTVRFTLTQQAAIHTNKTAEITPVIVNGNNSLDLPTFVLKGANAYKLYNRRFNLSGEEYITTRGAKPYAVVRSGKDMRYDYEVQVPFAEWMRGAKVQLRNNLCDCGDNLGTFKELLLASKIKLDVPPVPYVVQPKLSYLRPQVEAIKQRDIKGDAFLDFAVNKTDIRRDMGNNAAELDKILKLMESVYTDSDVSIRKVRIAGYASPEGTVAGNKKLSEGRAKALMAYLAERYDIPKKAYQATFGGEAWDGLVEALNQRNPSYKNEVIDIINNYSREQGRLERIKKVQGGAAYKEMFTEIFPSLRRVTMVIDFDVKNFTVEEARKVFATKPQNLSLNEMYLVSETMDPSSKEYAELFATAVRLFPNDPTANLNAAAAALKLGQVAQAKAHLDKAKALTNTAEYVNALGVLQLLSGDLNAAEVTLKKAASMGIEHAKHNLSELATKRADNEKRR